ncbi:hypothetical protein GL50803_003211 [Giardia duodenalis]|uniref:Uncharacterized protein n=1 Tax=Giardia intestinalis (strain ATCC 50803 / WB clone C6) TaxID=184922 RepID=A8BJF0_GIAIC|nr:hypothetical protein GL50803_003211 [Giardia intestinalis]KAE8303884.1 hypothetical protein GL50803_003211 [Giardia intestinalis]|eukprot:XP_001706572.1 Hypothetical protein GL50803_3211 [Giardia lamblia ATCC 50803]
MDDRLKRNKTAHASNQPALQSDALREDMLSISLGESPLGIQCQVAQDLLFSIPMESIGTSPPPVPTASTAVEASPRKRRADAGRATITISAKKQLVELWTQYHEQQPFDWYAKKCNIKSSSVRSLLWRLRKGDDITQPKTRGRRPMINDEAGRIIMETLQKPGGTIMEASQALAAAQRPISVPTISRALRRRDVPAFNVRIPLKLSRARQNSAAGARSLSRQERLSFFRSLNHALKDATDFLSSKDILISDDYSRLLIYINVSEWHFGPYRQYGVSLRSKHSFSRKSITKLTALTAIAGFPPNYTRQGPEIATVTGLNRAPPIELEKPMIFNQFLIGKPGPVAIDQWIAAMLAHFAEWPDVIFVIFDDVPLTVTADMALQQRGYVVTGHRALADLSPLEYLTPQMTAAVQALDAQQQSSDTDNLLKEMSEAIQNIDSDAVRDAVMWSCNSIWEVPLRT